jgi:hypothetical protein
VHWNSLQTNNEQTKETIPKEQESQKEPNEQERTTIELG